MALPAVRRISKGRLPPPLRLTAGIYLTDETDLFRCVSVAPSEDHNATVLLEDCRTLDLIVFPRDELNGSKLRIVEPHA